jgi:hypothetical protein
MRDPPYSSSDQSSLIALYVGSDQGQSEEDSNSAACRLASLSTYS